MHLTVLDVKYIIFIACQCDVLTLIYKVFSTDSLRFKWWFNDHFCIKQTLQF